MWRSTSCLLAISLLAGCSMGGSSEEELSSLEDRFVDLAMEKRQDSNKSRSRAMPKPSAPASMEMADGAAIGGLAEEEADYGEGGESGDEPAPEGEGGAKARTWFPETFLWQPLVQTDSDGVAQVDVLVPDQLTTWRVLALAHSRAGSQAGAVHTFDSRMDLYVDPVIPDFLHVGDRLDLPVQVVNTSATSSSQTLNVMTTGGL
ncbi:MAG: hypothetical protein ACI9MC_001599, partial [Kiritimatiellia bacterium]